MKLVSWNVNGLRAAIGKGFMDVFQEMDADVFCLQEIKMQQDQANIETDGYYQYWNSAEKKGYSGTLVFTKQEPIQVTYGIGLAEHDNEGRAITCEFEKFFLVNLYCPNSQPELARLAYRMQWEDGLRTYLAELRTKKPVVVCGDLNVAHEEIDLKNPASNRKNAGFTDEEREKFSELLASGFTDTFRYLYPDKTDAYSWWSYRFNARTNNAGWRIDYFLVSKDLNDKIDDSMIYKDIMGSDHCPVSLVLKNL